MAEEMSSNEVPMRDEFPAWMHEFELGGNDGARQFRWNGVISVTRCAEKDSIEPLVRIVFKSVTRSKPNSDALAEIVDAFRQAHPERPVDPSGREIEVLAAACLVVLIDSNENQALATATALAVTTASMCAARKPNLPMDLAGIASRQLRELSEANSRRPDLGPFLGTVLSPLNLDAAAKQYQAAQNADGFNAAMKTVADVTDNALKAVLQNQQRALNATAKTMAMQDEELQMLWWLIGGRSWDLDCPFQEVVTEARTLVMAKELADLTNIHPGPASIKGLLSRSYVEDTRTSIQKVVMATESGVTEWLNALLDDIGDEDPSSVTLPLHLAIKRQIEAGRGDTWVSAWTGAAGIPADFTCSQLQLAEHFYRERLLIDALRG